MAYFLKLHDLVFSLLVAIIELACLFAHIVSLTLELHNLTLKRFLFFSSFFKKLFLIHINKLLLVQQILADTNSVALRAPRIDKSLHMAGLTLTLLSLRVDLGG